MLTDDEAAELAALRARAFGPDADLADDPAGIARLDELEQRAHPDAAVTATPLAEVSRPDARDAAPSRPAAAPSHPAAATAAAATTATTRVPDPSSSPEQLAEAAAASAPPQDLHATSPAEKPPRPRRTWTRRAVLLVCIPAVALACAAGAALGANLNQPGAVTTPSPNTTLAAGYVASFRSISEMHTWDEGSPRLLADLSGTLVWDGTTGDGTVTCVVVDDDSQLPLSACQATDALTTEGVGVSVADPRTQATRTYVAWPNGAPMITYYSDDPNPSP